MSKLGIMRGLGILISGAAITLSTIAYYRGDHMSAALFLCVCTVGLAIALVCENRELLCDKKQYRCRLYKMDEDLRATLCETNAHKSRANVELALSDRLKAERDYSKDEHKVTARKLAISRDEHAATKRKLAAARGQVTKMKNRMG